MIQSIAIKEEHQKNVLDMPNIIYDGDRALCS